MGCSSYLRAPDPADQSEKLLVQFKYGFLREIEYDLGDDVVWDESEVPQKVDITGNALVPAWDMELARHFAIEVEGNKLIALSEISEDEADRMLKGEFDSDSRHAWKI